MIRVIYTSQKRKNLALVIETVPALVIPQWPVWRQEWFPHHVRVLLHHLLRAGAKEEVEVEDAAQGAEGQGWGRLEDNLWKLILL